MKPMGLNFNLSFSRCSFLVLMLSVAAGVCACSDEEQSASSGFEQMVLGPGVVRPEPVGKSLVSPRIAATIWLAMGNRMPVQVEKAGLASFIRYYAGHQLGEGDKDRKVSAGFDMALELARIWWHAEDLGSDSRYLALTPNLRWKAYRAVTLEVAAWITGNWTTEQILNSWLVAKGFEEEARWLFSRELKDLTVDQISFLAARFSPLYSWFCKSRRNGIDNRKHVLKRLLVAGVIEQAEYAQASLKPLSNNWIASAEKWPCESDSSSPCSQNSDLCRRYGHCSSGRVGCVAGSDKECRLSWSCIGHGRCRVSNGECVASSAQDCQSSYACRVLGHCRLSDGECRLSDEHRP